MAQLQIAEGFQFTRRAGADEPALREYRQVGNASCITHDSAAEGELQVCLHSVRTSVAQVVAAEQWKIGEAVYWHPWLDAGAGAFSRLESDAHVGYAVLPYMDDVASTNIAKSPGDASAWLNFTGEGRSRDFVAALDFAGALTPTAIGTYVLRDFTAEPAGSGRVGGLTFVHDGALAPGGATIQLGTLADPDAIYGPIDFTGLAALGAAYTSISAVAATPGLIVPEIVLTITAAAATAGKLRIGIRNTAF